MEDAIAEGQDEGNLDIGEEAQALELAKAEVTACEDAVRGAEAAMTSAARAARVFVLEEPNPSLDRLSALRAAGMPLVAVIGIRAKPVDPTAAAAGATPAAPPAPASGAPEGETKDLNTQLTELLEGVHQRLATARSDDPLHGLVTIEFTAGDKHGLFAQTRARRASTLAAATADGAAAAGGEQPALGPEAGQAQRAIEVLKEQVVAYETWRSGVKLFPVPDLAPPEVVDMRLYHGLMATVPETSATVPVILHCMLEQVARTAADEGGNGNQADAVNFTAEALQDAIHGVDSLANTGGPGLGVSAGGGGGLGAPRVLEEGDEMSVSSAGIYLGIKCRARNGSGSQGAGSPRSVLSGALAGLEVEALLDIDVTGSEEQPVRVDLMAANPSGWLSFLRKDGTLDVPKVEAHMLGLFQLPTRQQLVPEAVPLTEEAKGIEASVLHHCCDEAGTNLALTNHLRLLRSVVEALPAGVKAAHQAEVLSRRHIERLDTTTLSQVLSKASSAMPELAAAYLPSTDATVVALYGGTASTSDHGRLPVLTTFTDFFNEFVAKSGQAPVLPGIAYDVDRTMSAWSNEAKFLYPDDGSLVRVEKSGMTVYGISDVQYGLRPSLDAKGTSSFVATLRGGVVLQITAAAATDPLEQAGPMTVVCSLPSGTVVGINSMGHVTLSRGPAAAEKAASMVEPEAFRAVLPCGAVVQRGQQGSTRVLLPDGELLEQDTAAGGEGVTWVCTGSKGRRWSEREVSVPPTEEGGEPLVEVQRSSLPSIRVAEIVDPDTNAHVTTREDLVMVVDYATGNRLVLDRDDTRVFLHWVDKRNAKWLVESEGLPAVSGAMDSSSIHVNATPAIQLSWSAVTGAIVVHALDQQVAITAARGLVGVQRVSEVSGAMAESSSLVAVISEAREENAELIKVHEEARLRREEAERIAKEQAEAAAAAAAAAEAAAAGKKGKGGAAAPPAPAADAPAEPQVQITEPEEALPELLDVALVVAEGAMEAHVFDLLSEEFAIVTEEEVGCRAQRGEIETFKPEPEQASESVTEAEAPTSAAAEEDDETIGA